MYPVGASNSLIEITQSHNHTERYERRRRLNLTLTLTLTLSLTLNREIRKALAALAREVNDSEAKRLEIEGALRSAGGGVGIAEAREGGREGAVRRARAVPAFCFFWRWAQCVRLSTL